jgi:NADH-quinone oxidoreductase subunit L
MRRHWLYVALTTVLAAAAAAWAIPQLGDDRGTTHVWVRGDDLLGVSLATHVDGLAAQVMLLAVGVGLLVQIYSVAYLGDHPRYRSYALIIVLFLLAMLTVVVADDFFVLLVGWEVMGVCSYLLIGTSGRPPRRGPGRPRHS